MRTIVIIFFLLCSRAMLQAQIINGGFEDGMTGWTGAFGKIVTLNPHSGNSYFHSDGPPVYNLVILQNNRRSENEGGSKIPIGKYRLSCWYNATIDGRGEGIYCHAGISHNGIGSYDGGFAWLQSTNTWTKLTLFNFDTADSTTEDSVAISFVLTINGPSGYYKLEVDDFQLDTLTASIRDQLPNSLSISVSPNPISSHAHLKLHLENTASIYATIYDITGRKVLDLPSLESAGGDERIPFDVDEIPNGMYYLRCNIGGNTTTEKIIVNH